MVVSITSQSDDKTNDELNFEQDKRENNCLQSIVSEDNNSCELDQINIEDKSNSELDYKLL